METSKPPRVFISYSWESEDHKSWVRYLAERLYAAGIEARLDQWFVKPGESFTAFMEQEVDAADFVLVVCTPSYARKSNSRQGGVGYEQQIVSGQLMSGTARSKFIPILRKGEYELGPDCAIPTHFLGIAWIEFRDDAAFNESLEDLIRAIHSMPRFAPPPIGVRPPLETITDTILNRTRLTEPDDRRELPDSNRKIGDILKTHLEKAGIKLKPDDATTYHVHGTGYFDADDKDRTIAEYTRVIDDEPDDAGAYRLRLNRNRLTEAAGSREHPGSSVEKGESVKTDSLDDAAAYYKRGTAYFDSGDYDRAIADFSRAIESDPNNEYAYYWRGGAYAAKGDYVRAIGDYTRIIEFMPSFALAYCRRGDAYSALGDYDRAITDFNRFIEFVPNSAYSAIAYYNRGLAYTALGDRDRAIADFRKSLKLFTVPSHREYALEALRRLGAE